MNYPIASFSLHSIISRAQKAFHVENINYGIQRQRNNYKKCVVINNFKYLFCPYQSRVIIFIMKPNTKNQIFISKIDRLQQRVFIWGFYKGKLAKNEPFSVENSSPSPGRINLSNSSLFGMCSQLFVMINNTDHRKDNNAGQRRERW